MLSMLHSIEEVVVSNDDNESTATMMTESDSERGESAPLRKWLDGEMKAQNRQLQRSIFRKTTVAYAVAQLLRRAIKSSPMSPEKISLDNFIVRTKRQSVDTEIISTSSTQDILGVDMISEDLSLAILEPTYVNNMLELDEGAQGGTDRLLEVCISSSRESSSLSFDQIDEETICHWFGIFLYQLYSNLDFPTDSLKSNIDAEPAKKKVTNFVYSALHEIDIPTSIILLIQNLAESKCDHPLDPHNICSSLKEASDDLHLLLREPSRHLFKRKSNEYGGTKLQFRRDKLYGREKELSLLSEAFNRVSAGGNEAFFIGGFSGSGKTSLVESLMSVVEISGGYVVKLKLDAVKGRPLLELISAFNGLCLSLREKKSPQELDVIVNELTKSLDSDLSMLGRLLPDIYNLLPQGQLKQAREHGGNRMNFQSVCFILRQFMRVVSSKSHPVMLFVDDLQWSDRTALDVIHDILSDKSDARCFFVGSYRSNEVSPEHAIFELMKELESHKVPAQKLALDGLRVEDVNTLLSQALCTFPRITRSLSSVIHLKTQGNPFFCLEFTQSLVDRGLLRYSLRREAFEWDADKIGLENTTDNVLYLLTNKMNGLSNEVQTVLKILSCFGIKVNGNIISYLTSTSQYSEINAGIDEARSIGIISMTGEPSCYSFAHDKVREAAYSLVPDNEKHEFHSRLGMALLNASKGDELDDVTVLTIVCQLNRNLLLLEQCSDDIRIEVSSLNYKAGSISMNRSDFLTATHYLSIASKMLPNDHWQNNYKLSLQLNIATAKAAYSIGDTERSQAALNVIFNEATCMEDKLDAYSLVAFIHHSQEHGEEAYTTCRDVLTQLGEQIPEKISIEESQKLIVDTTALLKDLSLESLGEMKEMDASLQTIVKFYSFMAEISWFSRPLMMPYLCQRIAKITIENGLSKYSLVGFIQFSFALCNYKKVRSVSTVQIGCKLGEIAMSMLNNFDYSEVKSCVTHVYSYVHQHNHPIQRVAQRVVKGFESGIASGDTVSAFFNAVQHIRLSIIGGKRLPDVLRDTDNYLSIVGHHRNTLSRAYLETYRETVATLMGINTGVSVDHGECRELADQPYYRRRSAASNFHQALQSFFLGYNERCHHYIEKLLEENQTTGHHVLMASFYYGLNTFTLSRKGQLIKAAKLKQVSKDAILALSEAAELSKWNYRNKAILLQAELHSHEGKVDEAEAAYGAAITAARASNFVHEQGLACEYAAFHCKRNNKFDNAVNFFHEARMCYNEWGSSVKVDYCDRQMNQIRDSLMS